MSAPKRARPTFEFPYPLLDPAHSTPTEQADALLSDIEITEILIQMLSKKVQTIVEKRIAAIREQILATLESDAGRFNDQNQEYATAMQTLSAQFLPQTSFVWDVGDVGRRAQAWRTLFTAFSLIADAKDEKTKEQVVEQNKEAYGALLIDLITIHNTHISKYERPTSMPSVLDEIDDLLTRLLKPQAGATLLDTFLQNAVNSKQVQKLAAAQDVVDRLQGGFVSSITRPWIEQKHADFRTVVVQYQLDRILMEMYAKVNENLRAMHSLVLPFDVLHRQFGPRIVAIAVERTELLRAVPSRTSAIARQDVERAANQVFFTWIGDLYNQISIPDRVKYSIYTEMIE